MARPTYFSKFRRQVLTLHSEGMKPKAIADQLGMSISSVRVAMRAINKISAGRREPYVQIMRDAPSILVSALWNVGCDTTDMAKALHIPEAHIATILTNVRERDRVALREAA